MNIPFIPALYSSTREDDVIDMLVMHYTAGPTVDDCIEIFRNPDRSVSCHYIVGLGGEVIQMVHDQDCAWHCGLSSWEGQEKCNSRALGIEIVNWGRLERKGTEYYAWPDEYGQPYSGLPPAYSEGGWWAPYPERQIDGVVALSMLLIDTHHIPLKNVVGHSEIAPGRKIDPGPLFPWADVRKRLGTDHA